MREQLEERLRTLKAEFKTGQEMLAELEARGANLRVTLTRISGAVQVLEELLQQDAPDGQLSDSTPMSRPSMAA
jgi:predicted nuclease with TOPRIM domain